MAKPTLKPRKVSYLGVLIVVRTTTLVEQASLGHFHPVVTESPFCPEAGWVARPERPTDP